MNYYVNFAMTPGSRAIRSFSTSVARILASDVYFEASSRFIAYKLPANNRSKDRLPAVRQAGIHNNPVKAGYAAKGL